MNSTIDKTAIHSNDSPVYHAEIPNSRPIKTILTANEIAVHLKVSPKTVYQWAAQRLIPHLKLNGALRFDLDDVMLWLDGCRKKVRPWYNTPTKIEAQEGG